MTATQTPRNQSSRKAFGDKTNSPKKNSRKRPSPSQNTNGISPTKSINPFKSTHDSNSTTNPGPSKLSNTIDPFKTPAAPSQTEQSSAHSFITPTSNIGKKGFLKMRMAEIMDKEMGIDLNSWNEVENEQEELVELTEEEMWPEIEVMGNGEFAKSE